MVWNSGVFSTQYLQERLSCITFSQPFINLPGLSELVKSHPEMVSTLHAVYIADDMYPQILQCLSIPLEEFINYGSYGSVSHFVSPISGWFRNLHVSTV